MNEYRGDLFSSHDELLHYKYIKKERLPNGKWRYYYSRDIIGTDKKLTFSFDKMKRYSQAGKYWLRARMSTRVSDIVSGNTDFPTWKEAKEKVNYRYRFTDKDPL